MATMSDKRDYYDVLGVPRNATEAQVSEAYRKLAMKYHPDRNPEDDEAVGKFKESAEAFEVLSHPEKRARYDRYGLAGVEGGAPHFHDISDIFQAFGDILGGGLFGDIFGGGGGGRARRGADIRTEVTIDLMEAAHGTTKIVRFMRHQRCDTCGASGAKPGTKPETCRYCGGRGRVVQSTGMFSIQTTCPSCHGDGRVIRDACMDCRGSGYVQTKITHKLDIPVGVDNGTQLRLHGEGEPNPNGGPPGDCYCFVQVSEHPLFHRDGRNLICQVPITYSQAALGANIEVPTLEGKESLVIPPGTQTGEVITMRGRGMPDIRSRGKGNLLVQVHIEVPKNITKNHEELLRQLAEVENTHVSPKRKNFFDKLKEYFQP
jgi:molecular chaperone DnaJ